MESFLSKRRIFWVFVLFAIKESTGLKGPWITVPSAVSVGDTVTLICEYDLENVPLYVVKWYWNNEEFSRYNPGQNPECSYFPVDEMRVSSCGPNKVTLKNVKKELSGRYDCEVSTDAPLFQTEIQHAQMKVIALPTFGPTINSDNAKVNIGNRISAECIVAHSDPHANISWSINHEKISNNKNVNISPYFSQGDRISRKIEFVAEKSNFNNGTMLLECEARIFDLWNGTSQMAIEDNARLEEMAQQNIKPVLPEKNQVKNQEPNEAI